VIISASYKTDIPTFYGEWFMNRLRAGYCKMVNPWNRKQISRVSLELADVDGIVFWTKNIAPFLPHLKEVHDLGYRFVVQHTINNYPRALEYSVVDSNRSVQHLREVAELYGPRTCVWRYDTIVVTSLTPAEFHRENFSLLCADLAGVTDEVVVSFAHLYQKTLRNMNWASEEFGFSWHDPGADEKRDLLTELVPIAKAHGMQLTVCSQPDFVVPGTGEARCIDAQRLEEVSGRPIRSELRGARKECGCFASRDIGDYDTCPHGCVYCYAVQNRNLAQRRYREHDPQSEFLYPVSGVPDDEPRPDPQRKLF
jgi:hypothetical protein